MVAPSVRDERVPEPHANGDYLLFVEALKEAQAVNRTLSNELDAVTLKVEALHAAIRESEDELLRVRIERNAAFDGMDFMPCDVCQLDGAPTLCDVCWPRFVEVIHRAEKQRLQQANRGRLRSALRHP